MIGRVGETGTETGRDRSLFISVDLRPNLQILFHGTVQIANVRRKWYVRVCVRAQTHVARTDTRQGAKEGTCALWLLLAGLVGQA